MNRHSETERPFGWGIIGTGIIANQFAADLAFAPLAKIAAIRSRTPEKANAFGQKYGAEKAYSDLEAFFADPAIEAVYLATPNASHLDLALQAIRAGKPVLIEKPLALSKDQAQIILAASREHKIFAMEAMWSRFLPALRHVRNEVQAGAIGTVKRIKADLAYFRDETENPCFYLPDGGGPALDLGVYPLSLSFYLFGRPQAYAGSWQAAANGVDRAMSFNLQYEFGEAELSCASDRTGTNIFAIEGSTGTLQVHAPFLKAQSVSIYSSIFHQIPLIRQDKPLINQAARVLDKLPIPGRKARDFSFPGSGLQFQAMEAMDLIRKGAISSPLMPLEDSIAVLEIIDSVRASPPRSSSERLKSYSASDRAAAADLRCSKPAQAR